MTLIYNVNCLRLAWEASRDVEEVVCRFLKVLRGCVGTSVNKMLYVKRFYLCVYFVYILYCITRYSRIAGVKHFIAFVKCACFYKKRNRETMYQIKMCGE